MYGVKIKKGNYYYGKAKSKGNGFDLDRWLLEFLQSLEGGTVAVNTFNWNCTNDECGKNNLILKSGNTIKTLLPNKNLFNLEEYIFSLLKYHGVMQDSDWTTYCCETKPKLHLYKHILYFDKSNLKIHTKGGNLAIWLKDRLDKFTAGGTGVYTGITFNDLPCKNC